MRIIVMILALIPSLVVAQQTGVVDYPSFGVRFTIPSGWTGQESEGVYLMLSDIVPGFIALVPIEVNTLNELESEAKKGIVDDGVLLTLMGSLEKYGAKGVGGNFEGHINGQAAQAYIIGVINPFGQGLMVTAATSKDSYSNDYRILTEKIVSGIQFREPEESQKTKEWKEWLNGAKLSFLNSSYSSGASYGGYSTYSGYSQTIEIILCTNKSFSYASSSSSSFDTGGGFGSGNTKDGGDGKWEITGNENGDSYLKLNFSNGEYYTYKLTYEKSKTYLNDERYFVTHDHQRCR